MVFSRGQAGCDGSRQRPVHHAAEAGLDRGPLEEAVREGGAQQHVDGAPAVRFAKDGDIGGVPAKRGDVALDPAQRGQLIHVAVIAQHAGVRVFCGQGRVREVAEPAQPIVKAYEHHTLAAQNERRSRPQATHRH